MKRFLALMLSLLLLVSTVACSSDTEEAGESEEMDSGEEVIEVDKKLLNVEVTIPSMLFEVGEEDIDMEEVIADAKEKGMKDAKLNEDGSVTYIMSKATHSEMMEDMRRDMETVIDEILTDEELLSIQDIVADDGFREFSMIVDKEVYKNSFDVFAVMGIGFQSMFYQLFDGVDPDNYEAVIHVQDQGTGEVFETYVYPDELNK